MSPRHESDRLADIGRAIGVIREYSIARAHPDSMSMVIEDAIKYRLIEIGEAVGDLPSSTTARRPDVPWIEIKGLRNLLAHAYFDVDMRLVWTIVDAHLDALESAVEELSRQQ